MSGPGVHPGRAAINPDALACGNGATVLMAGKQLLMPMLGDRWCNGTYPQQCWHMAVREVLISLRGRGRSRERGMGVQGRGGVQGGGEGGVEVTSVTMLAYAHLVTLSITAIL